MSKKFSSATYLLVAGLGLFTIGLLVILRLNPFFGWLSQITPDAQVVEVVGVLSQFLGQALVVFGAMRSASHKFVSGMQTERQLTMASFAQNLQQFQAKVQNEQQTLRVGYIQTMAKLDAIIANQKLLAAQPKGSTETNCKFCGTRTLQGQFCSKCGKVN